jgi:peptidoglycan/LPS O-acetylase OafA/YrhL
MSFRGERPARPEVILSLPWIQRLSLVVQTMSAAAVSWHFYEKPLNDLKRFFPYNAPARAEKPVAPVMH